MVFSGINYRETYFEFPELTKVRGDPTSESLFKLRNELKANAKSVCSNLSDEDHGHLALVLSGAQHALLTPCPSSALSSQAHLSFLLTQVAPWLLQ
jgi:hypothetical protein